MISLKKSVFAILSAVVIIILLQASCAKDVTKEKQESTSLTLENNGLEVIISPIEDAKAEGTIKLEIMNAPAHAGSIIATLSPKDMAPTEDPFTAENVIGKIIEIGVTEVELDTTKVEDGAYLLGVSAIKTAEQQEEGKDPWFAKIQTEIQVSNRK